MTTTGTGYKQHESLILSGIKIGGWSPADAEIGIGRNVKKVGFHLGNIAEEPIGIKSRRVHDSDQSGE